MTLRVLVLSAGSLCAHNLLCLLAPRRDETFVIATNSVAEAAGIYMCDAAHLTPPAADAEAYEAALRRIIEAEAPDIVVPTREDDVVALARLKACYHGPATLLVGSLQAAEILEDKQRTADFAERHDLPFAPTADTLEAARALADRYGYPLIAKPAKGNGTREVTLLLEPAHLAAAFETAGMLVQPFLEGGVDPAPYQALLRRGLPFFFSFPEPNQHAYQVVIGADGTLSEAYISRNTMVMGKPERSERIWDTGLLAVGQAYAEAIRAEGWVGPFNAQFKPAAEGGWVGFELNGRFTGSSAARALSGFDEWDAVLRGFGFEAHARPPVETGVSVVHGILTHFPAPDGARQTLQATGSWRRSS